MTSEMPHSEKLVHEDYRFSLVPETKNIVAMKHMIQFSLNLSSIGKSHHYINNHKHIQVCRVVRKQAGYFNIKLA